MKSYTEMDVQVYVINNVNKMFRKIYRDVYAEIHL